MNERLGEMDDGSAAERSQMYRLKERIKKTLPSALSVRCDPLKEVFISSKLIETSEKNFHLVLSSRFSTLSFLNAFEDGSKSWL